MRASEKQIAIYLRVSSKAQDTKSQEPDLQRWIDAYGDGKTVVWYRDKLTGKNMNRPGWQRLEQDIAAGKVSKLVCWRIDRLGRTAKGLTALFADLTDRKVNLVSIKDGVDLFTPAGRLMANVLASVAAYETEVRAERVLAGQAVARAEGKTWGGSKKGRLLSVTKEQVSAIKRMAKASEKISTIAKSTGVSRPTVYRVLNS